MRELEGHTWHTYEDAARRVNKDPRTIKRWRRNGMPMSFNSAGERIVREDHLLEWFRQTLQNSPIHYYRMRAAAEKRGLPTPKPPARPQRDKPQPSTQTAETASDAPQAEWKAPQVVIPRIVKGSREYDALQNALRTTKPACDGIDEFTADKISPDTASMLATICATCPVRALCAAFAANGKPGSGFWAGTTVETRQSPASQLAS